MKNILIFGAGSIGNHMTRACLTMGYKIFITDKFEEALVRMRKKIYPTRYKKWDNRINQINYNKVFKLNIFFDLIIIGTPPVSHLNIFKECEKKLRFKKVLIEKPISNFLDNEIYNLKKNKKKIIFCGYNHSVNPSLNDFLNLIKKFSKVENIIINWREGWSGILGAHPWLKNEFGSYLGNYKKGGGSLQEHSHGIHALICILNKLNINNPKIKKKILFFKKKRNISYDYFSSFFVEAKKIFIKYETDLITFPAEKNILIKFKDYQIKWICNLKKNLDTVIIEKKQKKIIKTYKKTRSSEFVNEINHIMKIRTKKQYDNSPINVYNSLKVLKLIKTCLVKK